MELAQWCETWLGDIAGIYRLNKKRLSHYKPGLERRTRRLKPHSGPRKRDRAPVRHRHTAAVGAAQDGTRGQAAALIAEPSRGSERVPATARGADGQFLPSARCAARSSDGACRFGSDQRDGGATHRADVLGGGNIGAERHRRAPLAAGVAQGLRGQWWSRAAGLGRVVALVDEPDPLARPDGADMSQPIECRYYGRDFSAEEMALLQRAHRRAARPEPLRPVESVLPAHRLVQARRRAQGHDGARHHAGHAQGRADRLATAGGGATPPCP